LGEKKTHTCSLPDFKTYKKDKENDKELVKKLHDLMSKADVICAHNGDNFDIKKSNARFIYHGLTPPPPHKTVDTLKVARKHFSFNSNRLNDLCTYLGIGQKVETGGFKLWKGCMNGDMKSWKKMCAYNKQDVVILEKLYLKLLPWIENHPNMNLYNNTDKKCPNCGSSSLQKHGIAFKRSMKYVRYQCNQCGAWSKGKPIKSNIEIS
jgi:DNA polymerase elongation subunit (family B)